MSLRNWDLELKRVSAEIDQLKAAHARTYLTGNRTLVAKKVNIIQGQIGLDRTLTRMRKLTQREFMLLPRERALIHWGARYLEAVAVYAQLQTKYATRVLWLKLVRTRLSGAERGRDHETDQEDLVSLAVRQANLAKTEGYLAEALTALRRRKKDLTRRYHSLGVVAANHTAGLSLSARLGPTPVDALRSPTVRALETYVRLVTAPVAAASANQSLIDATTRAHNRTGGLLGLCRGLVIGRLQNPEAKATPRVLDKLQHAFDQLADLEAETREAYAQILGAGAPDGQSMGVQNPAGQAKTDAIN